MSQPTSRMQAAGFIEHLARDTRFPAPEFTSPSNRSLAKGPPLAKKSTRTAGPNNSKPESHVGNAGELHQTHSGDGRLTTNQGLPVADDQNTLTVGPRATVARRLYSPRENHSLRPRANPRTGRSRSRVCGTRLLSIVPVARRVDQSLVFARSVSQNASVLSVLYGGR